MMKNMDIISFVPYFFVNKKKIEKTENNNKHGRDGDFLLVVVSRFLFVLHLARYFAFSVIEKKAENCVYL